MFKIQCYSRRFTTSIFWSKQSIPGPVYFVLFSEGYLIVKVKMFVTAKTKTFETWKFSLTIPVKSERGRQNLPVILVQYYYRCSHRPWRHCGRIVHNFADPWSLYSICTVYCLITVDAKTAWPQSRTCNFCILSIYHFWFLSLFVSLSSKFYMTVSA